MLNPIVTKPTSIRLVVLLTIWFSVFLTACKADQNEAFIQRVWSYKDPHLSNIPAESAQYDSWIIDRKTFQNESCCFSKASFNGNYRIVQSDEAKIVLELYNLSGDIQGSPLSRDDKLEITIKTDPDADTIQINRTGPYTRLTSD